MKTFRSTSLFLIQPFALRRLLLVLLGLGLVQATSFAQSNIFSGVFWTGMSFPGFVNVAGQCNTAFKPEVYVLASSSCLPTTPWSITVTDSAGTPLTLSGLKIKSGTSLLETAGGSAPSFNLSSLAVGMGTLTVTDPCGNSELFALKIVGCIGGVALVPEIGFSSQIAPNRPATFFVQVANVGINPSPASTAFEVRDIPATTDCILTSIGMTPGTSGSGQKVSVSMNAINPGEQKGFIFEMQATPTFALGSTFTILAEVGAPYLTTDSQLVTVVASIDPNAKYGPVGYGTRHNIPKNTTLPYLITFENDPAALAPAQIVTITDYLDTSKVEPLSLQFGPVHFGHKLVAPPAGMNPFTVTVPYDVDNNPGTTADNIYVRVSGNVDQNPFSVTYGKVEWMFESLDAPGGTPPPISIGFLPPNITAPEGDGGVTFTVSQKANLAPGTLITNLASIVFDVNAPILTPVWTNRIAVPSTLQIDRINAGQVRVTWTGGTLEETDVLPAINWSAAPVQVSPWTFNPIAPQKFFRVRND